MQSGMTDSVAKVRVARLASRQFGLVTWAQLTYLGIPSSTLTTWREDGYLHPVLPRVHAVGHRARTVESELMAAILYAGPGAMLSHSTAAWWVGLARSRPYMTDVSTPRRCRSMPRIRVHDRRQLERAWHKSLPVTVFPQTMLDYATRATLTDVRLALARADFQAPLNAQAIAAVLKSGRPGSARLRTALERHMPSLADARSRVEIAFMLMCEAYHLPLPELNARVAGWDVDILWRRQRIAIEIDSPGNHRTPAQVRRDRRKEKDLRALTFLVLRYSDDQVLKEGADVMQEVCALHAERDGP
jgi:hypothetical protein